MNIISGKKYFKQISILLLICFVTTSNVYPSEFIDPPVKYLKIDDHTLLPSSGFKSLPSTDENIASKPLKGLLQGAEYLYMRDLLKELIRIEQTSGITIEDDAIKGFLLERIQDQKALTGFDLDNIHRDAENKSVIHIPYSDGKIKKIDLVFTLEKLNKRDSYQKDALHGKLDPGQTAGRKSRVKRTSNKKLKTQKHFPSKTALLFERNEAQLTRVKAGKKYTTILTKVFHSFMNSQYLLPEDMSGYLYVPFRRILEQNDFSDVSLSIYSPQEEEMYDAISGTPNNTVLFRDGLFTIFSFNIAERDKRSLNPETKVSIFVPRNFLFFIKNLSKTDPKLFEKWVRVIADNIILDVHKKEASSNDPFNLNMAKCLRDYQSYLNNSENLLSFFSPGESFSGTEIINRDFDLYKSFSSDGTIYIEILKKRIQICSPEISSEYEQGHVKFHLNYSNGNKRLTIKLKNKKTSVFERVSWYEQNKNDRSNKYYPVLKNSKSEGLDELIKILTDINTFKRDNIYAMQKQIWCNNAGIIDRRGYTTIHTDNKSFNLQVCQPGQYAGKSIDLGLKHIPDYGPIIFIRLHGYVNKSVINYYYGEDSILEAQSYLDAFDKNKIPPFKLDAAKYILDPTPAGEFALFFMKEPQALSGKKTILENMPGVDSKGFVLMPWGQKIKVCPAGRQRDITTTNWELFKHNTSGWMVECKGGKNREELFPINYFYYDEATGDIYNLRDNDNLKGDVLPLGRKDTISFLRGNKVIAPKNKNMFEMNGTIENGAISMQGYEKKVKVCFHTQFKGPHTIRFHLKSDINYDTLEISIKDKNGKYVITRVDYQELQDTEKGYISDTGRTIKFFTPIGKGISSLSELDMWYFMRGFHIEPLQRDTLIVEKYKLQSGRYRLSHDGKQVYIQVSDPSDDSVSNFKIQLLKYFEHGVIMGCSLLDRENNFKVTNYYYRTDNNDIVSLSRSSRNKEMAGLAGLDIFSFLMGKKVNPHHPNTAIIWGKVSKRGGTNIPIMNKAINICPFNKYPSQKYFVRFEFFRDKVHGNMVRCSVDAGKITFKEICEDLNFLTTDISSKIWDYIVEHKYITEKGERGENLNALISPEDLDFKEYLGDMTAEQIKMAEETVFNTIIRSVWVDENYYYQTEDLGKITVRNFRDGAKTGRFCPRTLEEFDKVNFFENVQIDYQKAITLRNKGINLPNAVKHGKLNFYYYRFFIGARYNGKHIKVRFSEDLANEIILDCYVTDENDQLNKIGMIKHDNNKNSLVFLSFNDESANLLQQQRYSDLGIILKLVEECTDNSKQYVSFNRLYDLTKKQPLWLMDRLNLLRDWGILTQLSGTMKYSLAIRSEPRTFNSLINKLPRLSDIQYDVVKFGIKEAYNIHIKPVLEHLGISTYLDMSISNDDQLKDTDETKFIRIYPSVGKIFSKRYDKTPELKEDLYKLLAALRKNNEGQLISSEAISEILNSTDINTAAFFAENNRAWLVEQIYTNPLKISELIPMLTDKLYKQITLENILDAAASFWFIAKNNRAMSSKLNMYGFPDAAKRLNKIISFEKKWFNIIKKENDNQKTQFIKIVNDALLNENNSEPEKDVYTPREIKPEPVTYNPEVTSEEIKVVVDKLKDIIKKPSDQRHGGKWYTFWNSLNEKQILIILSYALKTFEAKDITALRPVDFIRLKNIDGLQSGLPLDSLITFIKKKFNVTGGKALRRLYSDMIKWAQTEFFCTSREEALKKINSYFIGREDGYFYEDYENGFSPAPYSIEEKKLILKRLTDCTKQKYLSNFSTKEKLYIFSYIATAFSLKSISYINSGHFTHTKGKKDLDKLPIPLLVKWGQRRFGTTNAHESVKQIKKQFVSWAKKVFIVDTDDEAWACIDNLFLEERTQKEDYSDLVFDEAETTKLLNSLVINRNFNWAEMTTREMLFFIAILGRHLGVSSILQLNTTDYLTVDDIPEFSGTTLGRFLYFFNKQEGEDDGQVAALNKLNLRLIMWAIKKYNEPDPEKALKRLNYELLDPDRELFLEKDPVEPADQQLFYDSPDAVKTVTIIQTMLDPGFTKEVCFSPKFFEKWSKHKSFLIRKTTLKALIRDYRENKNPYSLKVIKSLINGSDFENLMHDLINIQVSSETTFSKESSINIFRDIYFFGMTYGEIEEKYGIEESITKNIVNKIWDQINDWDILKVIVYSLGIDRNGTEKIDPFNLMSQRGFIYSPEQVSFLSKENHKEEFLLKGITLHQQQIFNEVVRNVLTRGDSQPGVSTDIINDISGKTILPMLFRDKIKLHVENANFLNNRTNYAREDRDFESILRWGNASGGIFSYTCLFSETPEKTGNIHIFLPESSFLKLQELSRNNKVLYDEWITSQANTAVYLLGDKETGPKQETFVLKEFTPDVDALDDDELFNWLYVESILNTKQLELFKRAYIDRENIQNICNDIYKANLDKLNEEIKSIWKRIGKNSKIKAAFTKAGYNVLKKTGFVYTHSKITEPPVPLEKDANIITSGSDENNKKTKPGKKILSEKEGIYHLLKIDDKGKPISIDNAEKILDALIDGGILPEPGYSSPTAEDIIAAIGRGAAAKKNKYIFSDIFEKVYFDRIELDKLSSYYKVNEEYIFAALFKCWNLINKCQETRTICRQIGCDPIAKIDLTKKEEARQRNNIIRGFTNNIIGYLTDIHLKNKIVIAFDDSWISKEQLRFSATEQLITSLINQLEQTGFIRVIRSHNGPELGGILNKELLRMKKDNEIFSDVLIITGIENADNGVFNNIHFEAPDSHKQQSPFIAAIKDTKEKITKDTCEYYPIELIQIFSLVFELASPICKIKSSIKKNNIHAFMPKTKVQNKRLWYFELLPPMNKYNIPALTEQYEYFIKAIEMMA